MTGNFHRHRLEQHLDRLWGYAFSLSQNPDDAKDLVQECALKALGARNVPDEAPAYRAWLFRILRNSFIDLCRKRNVVQDWAMDAACFPDESMEYFQSVDRFINTLSVKHELAKLSAGQREIIGLIDIAGLSYAEAAEALNIPRGTVMSRISRARQALIQAVSNNNVRSLPTKRSR